ncbi:hypothetical protein SPFL3102_03581 [Sporomusaceae bacterium FL31]|nr:hypothetical protein SPFL3101_00424 [Sporomusaceae bacterium FL31]GCE35730.1 hypothetical protein SPFL3102_03581 [Sporomusaceae bacterium]
MGLISQTIKNLIAGVSQQAPRLRFPEQLEHQENCWSSEADGLQKRPPTVHIKNLMEYPGCCPLIHFVERDLTERYTMLFSGEDVTVWDLEGNEKVVNVEGEALAYITTDKPREDLKIITIADYSFILNTTKTVQMESTVSPNVWATQGALVNVKSGQYGRTYSININGSVIASFTTPDGSTSAHTAQIDTNYIAGKLRDAAVANGWTVTLGEAWLYLTKAGVTLNTIETKDGFNNLAMFGFLKSSQKYNILPATAPNGYTIEILGEPGTSSDNYYLVYDTVKGGWKETVKPNIQTTYDASTMPHVLIREADGTFTLKQAEWDKREVGDEDSNPLPSFVGKRIRDIFFFRNRLGFLSGENSILSKSGEFFKFWMTTAFEVLDTDYIDDAAPSESVATLNHAVPFEKILLLFSDSAQFVGRSEGVVTPKSFKIDNSTSYACEASARPVGAGRNIYFASARQEFTSLMEYYTVQDVSDVTNAQDVSGHVPSFIPNGIYSLLASARENVILALTEGDPTRIYLYKFLFQDEVRKQSSWSFWEFNAEVLGGGFIGSTLYLIMRRGTHIHLEKMLFTYNTKDLPEEPYRAFLDRKLVSPEFPEDIYDEISGTSQVNLETLYGSPLEEGSEYGLLLPDGVYRVVSPEDGLVEIPEDIGGLKIIVGKVFTAKWKPSTIMIKTDDGKGGTKAETEGRLTIQKFWVHFSESGYFKATVKHKGKETFEYEWTSRILGAESNTLGVVPLETGTFDIPVQSLNTSCEIIIESNAPTPFSFIGCGWRGSYNRRTQRT